MSGEMVKYQNDLNLVPLRKFTSKEIDLFFSMCQRTKNKDTETIRLTYKELKSLINYKSTSVDRFVTELENIYDKMLQLTFTERDGRNVRKFVLFHTYEINDNEKYLEISVNPNLKYILNNFEKEFTKFELSELVNIKSSFAKNMFRILKQFKTTGWFYININEFRERLDIPDSYRMTDITRQVLKPIIKELTPYFEGLEITKVKEKKGNKIKGIQFNFEKQMQDGEISFNHAPIKKSKTRGNVLVSRELTPKWLENRDEPKEPESPLTEEEIKMRDEFMKQLKEIWG